MPGEATTRAWDRDSGQARSRPQSVLFACTFNSVRSPIAEALARHYFGRDIYFASAGVRTSEADPFVAAVMDEIGIDVTGHRPQSFDDLEDASFDLIVTLSPEAHHKALDFTRVLAADVMYWPTMDPTAVQGSRDMIMDAYRGVRDALQARITQAFDTRQQGSH